MQHLARFFGRLAFFLVAAVVLLAPWFFGAWEMWGFWCFATALYAGTFCLGASWLLGGAAANPLSRGAVGLLAAFVPFLIYAYARFRQTPVYVDAERAFLLHFSAWLAALLVLASGGKAARRTLFVLLAADLFALGVYGIANHLIDGNRHVLWVPGFAQYVVEHRATGSYFCPDHFAGIMEFAICIGLAMALRCGAGALRVAGAALVGLGLVGVVLSKSRGGGLTLVVVAAGVIAWGFVHLPRAARLWLQLAAVAAILAGMVLVAAVASAYVERMGQYVGFRQTREMPRREAVTFMIDVFKAQDRPQMFAAAVRAWRSQPWVGIGPGMHLHVWPHYGPTPDGDRAARRWPSRPNNAYVSNAVHNDWLQLLEELGVIGVALFCVPAALVVACIRRRTLAATPEDARTWHRPEEGIEAAMPLAALLAAAAMAFHSIGDFNLQMPATVWLFATILAMPFGTRLRSETTAWQARLRTEAAARPAATPGDGDRAA